MSQIIVISREQLNHETIFKSSSQSAKNLVVQIRWTTTAEDVLIHLNNDMLDEWLFPYTILKDDSIVFDNSWSCNELEVDFRDIYESSYQYLVLGEGEDVLKNGEKTGMKARLSEEYSPHAAIKCNFGERTIQILDRTISSMISIHDDYDHIFDLPEIQGYIYMILCCTGLIKPTDVFYFCGQSMAYDAKLIKN